MTRRSRRRRPNRHLRQRRALLALLALLAVVPPGTVFGGGIPTIPADLSHEGNGTSEQLGTTLGTHGEMIAAGGVDLVRYLAWSSANGDWSQQGSSLPISPVLSVDLGFRWLVSADGSPGSSSVLLQYWDDTPTPVDPVTVPTAGDTEAVAVDFITMALGRPGAFGGSGRVTAWHNNHGTWEQGDTFQLVDSQGFGAAVDVDDDHISSILAIGIPGGSGQTGRVQLWRRAGGSWSLEATLMAPGGQANNDFGAAVAVDSGWLAVGAPLHDTSFPDPFGTDSGAVYLFQRDGSGSWNLTTTLVGSDGDHFGTALAMRTGTLAVGAPLEDVDTHPEVTNAGRVHLFRRGGGLWSYLAALQASDPGAFDHLGTSVGVTARGVVAGAPQWDHPSRDNAGIVYTWLGTVPLFVNGFESGSTSAWSSTSGRPETTPSDAAAVRHLGSASLSPR